MDVVGDFRQYVLERQRGLLRLAWLLTGDWSTAEDLVQTALLAVWPRWRRLGGGQAAHGYVRRVLVTTSRDWHARRWTGEVPVDVFPDQASSSSDAAAEDRLVLVRALQALPPRQRAVIVLRFFDDASEQATAEALRCSVGTVKSQTSKALASLRRHPSLVDLARTERSHD